MAKFHVISCHVLWRELCYYAALSKNIFTFHYLKQGLHNTPDILRQELQQAIDQVASDYDAILLGYGLCSNGLVGIQARHTKLVIMRGHDCITFFLGSRQYYQDYFNQYPGTYWYTPGWIDTCDMPGPERYQKALQAYREKYGADNAEYLMEMEQDWIKKYSKATYIDLNLNQNDHYRQFTQACAKWLGWQYEELVGNPQLVRDFIDGNWNSDDYLVVAPGEMIAAAHNEKIILTQPVIP